LPGAEGTQEATAAEGAQASLTELSHKPIRSGPPEAAQAPGAGLFPVTSSTIAAAAVLVGVARAYDIGARATCHLLTPGMNDTYLVATRGGRYIARVYRARW